MTPKRADELRKDPLWQARTHRLAGFIRHDIPVLVTISAALVLKQAYGGSWGAVRFLLGRMIGNWRIRAECDLKIRWWRLCGKEPLVELEREAE